MCGRKIAFTSNLNMCKQSNAYRQAICGWHKHKQLIHGQNNHPDCSIVRVALCFWCYVLSLPPCQRSRSLLIRVKIQKVTHSIRVGEDLKSMTRAFERNSGEQGFQVCWNELPSVFLRLPYLSFSLSLYGENFPFSAIGMMELLFVKSRKEKQRNCRFRNESENW